MATLARFAMLLCLACSSAPEDAQPPVKVAPVPPSDGVPARACGCADMTTFTIPAGQCFAVANGLWGSVEDDVVCFDLTPEDGTCTRTCAGYLEIKNTTDSPVLVAAFDKLSQSKPGAAQPGVMPPGVEQCDRMLNGPQPADSYKNAQPFTEGARFAGGPTADTFPSPGLSTCHVLEAP